MSNRIFFFFFTWECAWVPAFSVTDPIYSGVGQYLLQPGPPDFKGLLFSLGTFKTHLWTFLPPKCFLHMSPLLTTFMALEIEKAQIRAPGYWFSSSLCSPAYVCCQVSHEARSAVLAATSGCQWHFCSVPHLSCYVTINQTALRRAIPDSELKPSSLPRPSMGCLSAMIFPWLPPGFRKLCLYPHPQVPSTAK